jgi:PAS domain-containing protein
VAARRSPAVVLLAVGAVGALCADAAYGLSQMDGGWRPGGPAELGYLVFYVAWGLAALQPSMADLTVPVFPPVEVPRRRSLVLLALALAVLPVAVLVGPADRTLVAAVALLLGALAFTRLSDAVARHRWGVARERSLREASASLVAAASAADVDAGVRAAVGELVPPGVGYGVVLVLGDAPFPLPATGPGRRTRLVSARAVHPGLRDAVGGFPAVLVCPLVLDRSSADDPRTGALVVAAHERVLAASQDAVEVLAAQATLALERIALTVAVQRRDRQEYLDAVVAHTADAVLVVDDDGRVRYASPSLSGSLGVELPLFATVGDLVAEEDRQQVTSALAGSVLEDRVVWRLLLPNGSRVLVDVRVRDLRQDRMVGGFVLTMRPVVVNEGAALSLERSAGAQNRRGSADKFNWRV